MASPVRRVVTEQAAGLGRIASDSDARSVTEVPGGSVVEVWRADRLGRVHPTDGPWVLEPPPGGSLLRIVDLAPNETDAAGWMHRTPTIDYVIVLDGEITLVTDEGERAIGAGEVVVQQAATHAWENRSGRPCRMAVVMIDTGAAPA